MNATLKYSFLCTGLIAGLAVTGQAFAQSTPLNIGGSSAGKQFAGDVPLDLCDTPASGVTPHHYMSANQNLHVWTCKRNTADIIIRYSATGSSDGVNKLLQPATDPASNMNFLDHTVTTGCTTVLGKTRPSDGRVYDDTTGCLDTNTVSLPVHMGASDVQGSSFHQVGPVNPPSGPPVTVNPLNDGSLNSSPVVVVPFSLFVGKGVVKVDPVTGNPNGPISGLSRLEIEGIFNRNITDWRQLGLGTVTDAAPGTLEATSPITICMRNAGSGTKATFDETVMINQPETTVNIPGTAVFSSGTSGVLTCLAGNRRSIGYMDADQLLQFTNALLPNGNPNPNIGLGYLIGIDGAKAYDASLTDPKRDLKCGRYPYWANWRLNRRAAGEPDANINTLAQAFITDAGLQSTIGILQTGAFWASDEEMFVSKNQDRGPLLYKAGAHNACR